MTVVLLNGPVTVTPPLPNVTVIPPTGTVQVSNQPVVNIGTSAALDAHIASPRPHQAAESGYDAAGFFTALTT